MKSVTTLFFAALLFATNVAHAKPSKSRPAPSLRCTLTELEYWDVPDLYDEDSMIVVRLKCHNGSKAPARVKARDVVLINSAGDKYGPDRRSEHFDSIYQDESEPPMFVDHFVEIAPGQTVDIGFTFSGDDGLTDDHLTLDVDGVKYAHQRESSASDSGE
jgi:hypothetical protein